MKVKKLNENENKTRACGVVAVGAKKRPRVFLGTVYLLLRVAFQYDNRVPSLSHQFLPYTILIVVFLSMQ